MSIQIFRLSSPTGGFEDLYFSFRSSAVEYLNDYWLQSKHYRPRGCYINKGVDEGEELEICLPDGNYYDLFLIEPIRLYHRPDSVQMNE
jgi:hypothetical protein